MTSSPRGWRAGRLLAIMVPLLLACDTGTEPIPVGSIVIGPVGTHLTIGTTVQLSATVLSTSGSALSGHPVVWNSSNEAVASITPGGAMTALTAGTATIQASSEGKSASLTFTVEAGPCAAATAGAISLGQTRTGTLGPTDCILYDGRAQGWTLQIPAATGVRIVIRTTAFSPYLLITGRTLNPVLWARWHPEGAEILGELPAGEYIVWAMGGPGGSGAYQIEASAVEFCTAASATTTIGIGETHSGTLRQNDCLLPSGTTGVGARLSVPTATSIRIDLTSSAFDALLFVTDGDMNLFWGDDDSGSGSNARIHRRFPAGDYIIWTTSWDTGASGGYQLSVAEAEIELCATVGALELGQSVSGALSSTDCTMNGWYVDPWRLSVSAQTTVRIDLTSNQFDTFLVVEDEYGDVLAWDDDGGEGLNSRLVFTFAPGEYRVLATSFGAGATGAYQLGAQALAGGAAVLTAPASDSRAAWRKASKP